MLNDIKTKMKKWINSFYDFDFHLEKVMNWFFRNWELLPVFLLALLLYNFSNDQSIEKVGNKLTSLSGLISAIIIGFISAYVIQIKRERIEDRKEIDKYTQKLTSFRRIAKALVNSHNFWVKNGDNYLPYYIDKQGVTHFEIRKSNQVYQKNSKKISDFINDLTFGDSKYLYLELKSFLPKVSSHFLGDETLLTEFDVNIRYNTKYIEHLIESDCGGGLYYYFDHKKQAYSSEFRFDAIPSAYLETIEREIIKIDKERYQGLNVGSEMLSKLGTQLRDYILPNLYRFQQENEKPLPFIINYLYTILSILIIFGIVFPVANDLTIMSTRLNLFCSIVILSVAFYLVLAYKKFLSREVRGI